MGKCPLHGFIALGRTSLVPSIPVLPPHGDGDSDGDGGSEVCCLEATPRSQWPAGGSCSEDKQDKAAGPLGTVWVQGESGRGDGTSSSCWRPPCRQARPFQCVREPHSPSGGQF